MKYTSKYHHGQPIKKQPEYKSFTNMLTRCNNPNSTNYHRWGGRGIKVCGRWSGENGYDYFLKDMGVKPSPKHQLDRIDNDKDYSPENCRWATQKEQMGNTRRTIKVEYGGSRWDIPSLAVVLNVKEATLRYRISHNIPKRYWGSKTRVPQKLLQEYA